MDKPVTKSTNTMSTRASSIARALDQIGDKWSLLIMQEVFLGIHSFNDMLDATGVSRGVLSDRLKWLESMDCLKKQEKAAGSRRSSYHLTRKSADLYANALMALVWEKRYFPSPALNGLTLLHTDCGQSFWPEMRCQACQREIFAADVEYQPGPGATKDIRLKKVRRRSSISIMDGEGGKTLYKNLIHLVGDRWTANIIALAYHGLSRFDEFNRELPIATNILTARLKFLVEEGIFEPRAYQDNPPRYAYQLSAKGTALFPWFLTLLQWGDAWCDTQNLGKPMQLMHTCCQQPLRGEVVCNQCQCELKAHAVQFSSAAL